MKAWVIKKKSTGVFVYQNEEFYTDDWNHVKIYQTRNEARNSKQSHETVKKVNVEITLV